MSLDAAGNNSIRTGNNGSVKLTSFKGGIKKAQISDDNMKTIFDKIDNGDGILTDEEIARFKEELAQTAKNDKLSKREAKKFLKSGDKPVDTKEVSADDLYKFMKEVGSISEQSTVQKAEEQTLEDGTKRVVITSDEGNTVETINEDHSSSIVRTDDTTVTTENYDENQTLVSKEEIDSSNPENPQTTLTEYNPPKEGEEPTAKRITVTSNGYSSVTDCDEEGRKYQTVESGEGYESTTIFDKEGEPFEKHEVKGSVTSDYSYVEGKEFLVRREEQKGEDVTSISTYEYTDENNYVETNVQGDKTVVTTYQDGKKTHIKEGDKETSITYTENGSTEITKDGKGNITKTDLNADGNRLSQTKVVGGKQYSVNYDGQGHTTGIIVQNGESPAAIAKKFGCNLNDLMSLNKGVLQGKKYFPVGAEIKLPKEIEADSKALQGRKSAQEAKAEYARDEQIRQQKREYESSLGLKNTKGRGQTYTSTKGKKYTIVGQGSCERTIVTDSKGQYHVFAKDGVELKLDYVKSDVSHVKQGHKRTVVNGRAYYVTGDRNDGHGRQNAVDWTGSEVVLSADDPKKGGPKVLNKGYVEASDARDAGKAQGTISGGKDVTYVKDSSGKVWYFDSKTGAALVGKEYNEMIQKEADAISDKLYNAANYVFGTDEEALSEGVSNIYSADILARVNSNLSAKDSDYRGDSSTMPLEALILDEESHGNARTYFKTLINNGVLSTEQNANMVSREMEHELHGRTFGYTSTSGLNDAMSLCQNRDVRLQVEENVKNDHPELKADNGSMVRAYIGADGWEDYEVDMFDSNWVANNSYDTEHDQEHRNGVIGRLCFDYDKEETLHRGLKACNDDPESEDYKNLAARAAEENEARGYETQFTDQEAVQTYLAGRATEDNVVDVEQLSACNTLLFKGEKPARVQAEESSYAAKSGDMTQVFDSMDSEVYAEMAKIAANGDIPGCKTVEDMYNKAMEQAKPNAKASIKANAILSGQVEFSQQEIADFCVSLMHQIDTNKGQGSSSGVSASHTNAAEYQTEQLKAILEQHPEVISDVKEQVEKGEFQSVTVIMTDSGPNAPTTSTKFVTDTKASYLELLNNTNSIADKGVFLDENGNEITNPEQIAAIKKANQEALQGMRDYVAQMEREFRMSVDEEGWLGDAGNSILEYSGLGTDRQDAMNLYREAKRQLKQLEAAAEGKLRNSEGKVVSAQEIAQNIINNEELASANSDYQTSVGMAKMGIVLAPVIVATTVVTGGAGLTGWAAVGGAAATTAAVEGVMYGTDLATSETGNTAENRAKTTEQVLWDTGMAGAGVGVGQMAEKFAVAGIEGAGAVMSKGAKVSTSASNTASKANMASRFTSFANKTAAGRKITSGLSKATGVVKNSKVGQAVSSGTSKVSNYSSKLVEGVKDSRIAKKAVEIDQKVNENLAKVSEKMVQKQVSALRKIAPNMSEEATKKAAVVIARCEAAVGEISSDAIQSVVQSYCQEGHFDEASFYQGMILSLAGNAVGHVTSGVGEYRGVAKAKNGLDVATSEGAHISGGKLGDAKYNQLKSDLAEELPTASAQRGAQLKHEADIHQSRTQRREIQGMIDEEFGVVTTGKEHVNVGGTERGAEYIQQVNADTKASASAILSGEKGGLSPQEASILSEHLVNNLNSEAEISQFMSDLKNRVGVDEKGNMHVYQVNGKNQAADVMKSAEAKLNKIKANNAQFAQATEALDNAIQTGKGLNEHQLATVRGFVKNTESAEDLSTLIRTFENNKNLRNSSQAKSLVKDMKAKAESLRANQAPSNVSVAPTGGAAAAVGVAAKADSAPKSHSAAETPATEIKHSAGEVKPETVKADADVDVDTPHETPVSDVAGTNNDIDVEPVAPKTDVDAPEVKAEDAFCKDFSSSKYGTELPKNEPVVMNIDQGLLLGNGFEVDFNSSYMRGKMKNLKDGEYLTVGLNGDIGVPSSFKGVADQHLRIEKVDGQIVVTQLTDNKTVVSKASANPNNNIQIAKPKIEGLETDVDIKIGGGELPKGPAPKLDLNSMDAQQVGRALEKEISKLYPELDPTSVYTVLHNKHTVAARYEICRDLKAKGLSAEEAKQFLNSTTEKNLSFAKSLLEDPDFSADRASRLLIRTNDSNVNLVKRLYYDKNLKTDFAEALSVSVTPENKGVANILLDRGDISAPKMETILRSSRKNNIQVAEVLCKDSSFSPDDVIGILTKTNDKNAALIENCCKNYKDLGIKQSQIIQVAKENISLDDLQFLNKRIDADVLSKFEEKDFRLASDFLPFHSKDCISELSKTEKKDYLFKVLVNKSALEENPGYLNELIPLMPRNSKTYEKTVKGVTQSLNMDVKPLSPEALKAFDDNLQNMATSLKTMDLSGLHSIELTMPQSEFTRQVDDILKDLPPVERAKVQDYFGFRVDKDGKLSGYPNTRTKDLEAFGITDQKTIDKLGQVSPVVDKYTSSNFVTTNDIPELNNYLKELSISMPEIFNQIDGTANSVQTIKQMQAVVNNPKFDTLSPSDQKTMMLATLLHNTDKASGSTAEAAFDAYFIAKRFNISDTEADKLCKVIEASDAIEKFTNTQKARTGNRYARMQREEVVDGLAFNLKEGNTFDMAQMLYSTKGKDGLTRNLDKVIESRIREIKSKDFILPQTTADTYAKHAKVEVHERNGVRYEVKVVDSTDIDNFLAFIHTPEATYVTGGSRTANFVNFEIFKGFADDKVICTSYVTNGKAGLVGQYHHGFIFDVQNERQYVGYHNDMFSESKNLVDMRNEYYTDRGLDAIGRSGDKFVDHRSHISDTLKTNLYGEDYRALSASFNQKSNAIYENYKDRVRTLESQKRIRKQNGEDFTDINNELTEINNQIKKEISELPELPKMQKLDDDYIARMDNVKEKLGTETMTLDNIREIDPELADAYEKMLKANNDDPTFLLNGEKHNEVLVSNPKIQALYTDDISKIPVEYLEKAQAENIPIVVIKDTGFSGPGKKIADTPEAKTTPAPAKKAEPTPAPAKAKVAEPEVKPNTPAAAKATAPETPAKPAKPAVAPAKTAPAPTPVAKVQRRPELDKYKCDKSAPVQDHMDFVSSDLFDGVKIFDDSGWASQNKHTQAGPWKMHLYSVEEKDWQNMAQAIVPYLREHDINWKTLDFMSEADSMDGTVQAGKSFTIYPKDNAQMEQIAKDLDYIIKQNKLETTNSHIVGDRAMGDSGRLFYRYEYNTGKAKDQLFDTSQPDQAQALHNLYDSNEARVEKLGDEGNYLASDMTVSDDPWYNFNPSDPNSKVAPSNQSLPPTPAPAVQPAKAPAKKAASTPAAQNDVVIESVYVDFSLAKPNTDIPKNTPVSLRKDQSLTLGSHYTLDLNSPKVRSKIEKLQDGQSLIVGREGDILVPEAFEDVSRQHLRIEKVGDDIVVTNISNTSPVKVNNTSRLAAQEGFDIRAAVDNLSEDELVRTVGNNGNFVDQRYISNSKDVREHLLTAMADGSYLDSYESYKEVMAEAHRLAYEGKSGNNRYYMKNNVLLEMTPGKFRKGVSLSAYNDEAFEVEAIARKYGDPYRVHNRSQKVEMRGIERNYLPQNNWSKQYDGIDYNACHIYPDSDAMEGYYFHMHRTSKEAMELIENGASEDQILAKLAEHYQYAANARPYAQINNSLFMNEVNTMLVKAGMDTMPHGKLDHVAQRLQPESFKKYFIDEYNKTRISRKPIEVVDVEVAGVEPVRTVNFDDDFEIIGVTNDVDAIITPMVDNAVNYNQNNFSFMDFEVGADFMEDFNKMKDTFQKLKNAPDMATRGELVGQELKSFIKNNRKEFKKLVKSYAMNAVQPVAEDAIEHVLVKLGADPDTIHMIRESYDTVNELRNVGHLTHSNHWDDIIDYVSSDLTPDFDSAIVNEGIDYIADSITTDNYFEPETPEFIAQANHHNSNIEEYYDVSDDVNIHSYDDVNVDEDSFDSWNTPEEDYNTPDYGSFDDMGGMF